MIKNHRYSVLVIIITVFLAISLACGGSTARQLASAVPPTAIPATAVTATAIPPTAIPTQAGAESPKTELPPTIQPMSTTTPKASATLKPEALQLMAQGMGQKETDLGYGFVVKNPNTQLAIEDSQYQIALYDTEGVVIETDSGYISLLLPGQQLGIGGMMFLNEGVIAGRIEVQLNAGRMVDSDLFTTFTTEKETFSAGEYYSYIRGVINNPYDRDMTSLQVSAIVYNAAKEIIGGGLTYMSFVLANSSSGIEIPVTSNGEVTSVEIYPSLSGLSMLGESEALPEGASNLVLSQYGYGQDGSGLGFGMIVENPNQDYLVENSMYHITGYAEDGSVLGVSEGYIDLLLPAQILGIADSLYLEEGILVDKVDVQIKGGNFAASDVLPLFTIENVNFLPDEYMPEVTGEVFNPYNKEVTYVKVIALAYDDAGEIIGSGITYLDFIPANSKAAASVYITVAETPASVELFAAVSALSEIQE